MAATLCLPGETCAYDFRGLMSTVRQFRDAGSVFVCVCLYHACVSEYICEHTALTTSEELRLCTVYCVQHSLEGVAHASSRMPMMGLVCRPHTVPCGRGPCLMAGASSFDE